MIINFKKIILFLLLTIINYSVIASEVIILNITGVAIPGACHVNIYTQPDYGVINANKFGKKRSNVDLYQIGTKKVSYSINCQATTVAYFNFKADLIAPDFPKDKGYKIYNSITGKYQNDPELIASLGKVNGQNIGYYYIEFPERMDTIDGSLRNRIKSNDLSYWELVNNKTVNLSGNEYYAWYESLSNLTPIAFRELTGYLYVSSALNPEVINSINDSLSFDTNTVISLYYI